MANPSKTPAQSGQLLLDWYTNIRTPSASALDPQDAIPQVPRSLGHAATAERPDRPPALSPGAAAIVHAHLPPPNPEQYMQSSVEPFDNSSCNAPVVPAALVQVLPWDFRTSFPEPLEEAIETGRLNEDDAAPDNLKSLHEEHARHLLVLLAELDAVLDAKRRGVDPRTGRLPKTPKQIEQLNRLFRDEPGRLEREFEVLMDVYEEAFGTEATDSFRKAIRAWHAGVEVISETSPTLPPLKAAIDAGAFGSDDNGSVVNPTVEEVRGITEQVTEELIPLPDGPERKALLSKYAEDFGEDAARELDRWSRLKPEADEVDDHNYDPAHPWHYYHEGDGAEPLPLEQIPARPAALEHFGIKWPQNSAKRRARMEQVLVSQRKQLAEDEARYQDLIENGIQALSGYDRDIAHAGDVDLAWASAIALKFVHVSGGRGRIECLEEQLGLKPRP